MAHVELVVDLEEPSLWWNVDQAQYVLFSDAEWDCEQDFGHFDYYKTIKE